MKARAAGTTGRGRAASWLAAAALLAPPHAAGAQDDAPDAEIEHLLRYVAQSGCQYERNGSLHGSAEAASHMRMKWTHLRERGHALTAERFIADVASHSGLSGRPYRVHCKGHPAQASGHWLTQELQHHRQHPQAGPAAGRS